MRFRFAPKSVYFRINVFTNIFVNAKYHNSLKWRLSSWPENCKHTLFKQKEDLHLCVENWTDVDTVLFSFNYNYREKVSWLPLNLERYSNIFSSVTRVNKLFCLASAFLNQKASSKRCAQMIFFILSSLKFGCDR